MPLKTFFFTIINFLALVLVLQSCQCAAPLQPPVMNIQAKHRALELYVSSEFDINEVMLIEDAAMQWEQATNHIVTFNIYFNFDMKDYDKLKYSPDTLVITRLSKHDSLVLKLDNDTNHGTSSHIIGYCYKDADQHYPIATLIIVWDRMTGDTYFKGTVMHEMGHALGMKHIDVENTLMYPYMDKASRTITDTDLVSFCNIYRCKASELK